MNAVIGSLELALPFWMVCPTTYVGMGYESRRNGMTVLISCAIIAWMNKRSRYVRFMENAIQQSPLRGFRIGIGSTMFVLVCVSLIPITLDPKESILGLLCFSVYLSLIFLGIVLGIISLENLRGIVTNSMEEENGKKSQRGKTVSVISTSGRVLGYICVAPFYRWLVRKEMSFLFLCLLACVCWLLYVVSFSLHTAAPSPTTTSRRKESQFITAMSGLVSFSQEAFLVAFADVSFLLNEFSRKENARA